MEDMLPFQGLRGVCAMAIFLGHQTDLFVASQPLGLEYLQAVSLFFLLSGIPLTRLYSDKVATFEGRREFWRKRWARLAPIYYLTLILNLIVLWVLRDPQSQVTLKDALTSFFGCSVLMQSWFVAQFINVGGVLWQVAVFAYGYVLFPFVSPRITQWTDTALFFGILFLWLFSLGLWAAVLLWMEPDVHLFGWWLWHVHCVSRLPQLLAGVLLGELVERKRDANNRHDSNNYVVHNRWVLGTDCLSLMLLATAIQSPIVQWYYGQETRDSVSIALEAILLPLHVIWLAGIVLSYPSNNTSLTREVLSFRPLVFLGDMSLVLYCVHLVVLFAYTSVVSYFTTGNAQILMDMYYTLSVRLPWWPHIWIQWGLVLGFSWAVSKWFEGPLRQRLAPTGRARQPRPAGAIFTAEEETLLLPNSAQ